MKNFIKNSLIAVLLFSSVGLYANDDDFSFAVKRVDDKTVTFAINETQVVDLSIHGENNEVLYAKKINVVKGSSKSFNMNSLPDGDYTFKMLTDVKITEYKVQLKDGRALVSEPLITGLLSPILTKMNDVVTLRLADAPEGTIEIEIVDQRNNQVYIKAFEGGGDFVKKFDIAQGDSRELTFIVRAGEQVFSETIQMY